MAQRLLPAAPAADALHVRGVGSVIVSDDTALLDELVAADGLAPLKLRRIAPTVAGSALSPVDTLAALRAADTSPARDAGPGPVRLHRARVDHARRAPARSTVDPGELAARLLVPQQRRPDPPRAHPATGPAAAPGTGPAAGDRGRGRLTGAGSATSTPAAAPPSG